MMRKREVAKRVFAHEVNQSTHKIELEGERAPIYILLPTGERCNRLFVVGVLLDKEEVKPESNFWRVRVSDPTGVFDCTAGRYQPDALEALMEIEPPEMISVAGKINVYEGESKNFVSLRPESVTVADKEVRNYWVYETAKRTLERISRMQNHEDQDVTLSWEVYNPNLEQYKDAVKKALLAIKEEFEAFEPEKQGEKEEESPEDLEEEEWDLSDIIGE